MRTHRVLLALGAIGASVVLGAVPASATTLLQTFHQQVNESLTDIPQCGFTVDSHVQGTLAFQMFLEASGNVFIQNESHVVSTLTNVANGKVVYVENASRDAFTATPIVNPDGTMTATDTFAGMTGRVYTDHSDVLVKDVGFLSAVATLDSAGNLLNVQVIMHPGFQFFGPDDPAYCAAIAAAIGP
jgi:hypothetical protein